MGCRHCDHLVERVNEVGVTPAGLMAPMAAVDSLREKMHVLTILYSREEPPFPVVTMADRMFISALFQDDYRDHRAGRDGVHDEPRCHNLKIVPTKE